MARPALRGARGRGAVARRAARPLETESCRRRYHSPTGRGSWPEARQRESHAVLERGIGNALAALGRLPRLDGADAEPSQPGNDFSSFLLGGGLARLSRRTLCRRGPSLLALAGNELGSVGTLGFILVVRPRPRRPVGGSGGRAAPGPSAGRRPS